MVAIVREECNLYFIVGRSGEFGESYYIRSFRIGDQVSVYDLYADSKWVVWNPSLSLTYLAFCHLF